jgi:hypothetical protein
LAVLGFGEFGRWLHLLSTQVDVLYRQGYGLVALAGHFGVGRSGGTALEGVVCALIAIACVRQARRGLEAQAYTLAVTLMLVSSPLVDNHYFALLIVPLAIAQPCLSGVWLGPFALWLCPATHVAGWQAAVAWLTVGGLLAWLVRSKTATDAGASTKLQQRLATGRRFGFRAP